MDIHVSEWMEPNRWSGEIPQVFPHGLMGGGGRWQVRMCSNAIWTLFWGLDTHGRRENRSICFLSSSSCSPSSSLPSPNISSPSTWNAIQKSLMHVTHPTFLYIFPLVTSEWVTFGSYWYFKTIIKLSLWFEWVRRRLGEICAAVNTFHRGKSSIFDLWP